MTNPTVEANPIITEFFNKVRVHLKSNPHGQCAVESALEQALSQAREEGAREARKDFEPDVKLAKSCREQGYENAALWIETKNDKYLEHFMGIPEGSFKKFSKE